MLYFLFFNSTVGPNPFNGEITQTRSLKYFPDGVKVSRRKTARRMWNNVGNGD